MKVYLSKRASTVGTTMQLPGAPKKSVRPGSFQSKAWTPHFAVVTAFSRMALIQRDTVRSTHRSLDAGAVCLDAALHKQLESVRGFTMSMASRAAECPWIWLQVAWDETPLKLQFGSMMEALRPMARHWWRDGPGDTWKLLTVRETIEKGLTLSKKPAGVLQTLGVDATLSWAQWERGQKANGERVENLCLRREPLLIQPRYIASACASQIASGLDDALQTLNWEGIQRMIASSSGCKFFAITLNADLASPNNVVKHFFGERVKEHNCRVAVAGSGTWILLIPAACLSHVLNGVQSHAFKVRFLVPKMYNVCFTFANIHRWNIVKAALTARVKDDMSMHFSGARGPHLAAWTTITDCCAQPS